MPEPEVPEMAVAGMRLYMERIERLIAELRRDADVASATRAEGTRDAMTKNYFAGKEDAFNDAASRLEKAAYKDQHQLFHDDEFHEGCAICDREREEYS